MRIFRRYFLNWKIKKLLEFFQFGKKISDSFSIIQFEKFHELTI